MLEALKKYLSKTPPEQIAKDWEEATKDVECDSPTVGELIDTFNIVDKNEPIDTVIKCAWSDCDSPAAEDSCMCEFCKGLQSMF